MTIYLKNATYIDWQSLVFQQTDLAVSENEKQALQMIEKAPEQDLLTKNDTLIDCSGKLVTKSFGCGHHHIYSTLARGMPAPAQSPTNFVEILKYVWWHLDKNLDLEMIKASALASAIYSAKNGVTFIIDHHASPFAVEGCLQTIKDAFDSVGVGSLLCYELSDRDGEDSKNQALAETESFIENGNQGLVGLHASFTVGDDLLKKSAALAEKLNSGLHIHVAEDKADQVNCLKEHGKRVIHRLNEAGFLAHSKTILGHCLHLDDEEKKCVRESNSWVVENVESNLNNAVGLTDYSQYGGKIMLGTDGMHSDMLRSAKAAFITGQTTEGISFPDAYTRFRNVHHYLSENEFEGDGDNNLVILDYNPPTEINANNFLGHFLFGIESGHVESVISDGRLIVENRKLLTVNEKEILEFTKAQGLRLWEKLQ
jgi:cytosine/adenosine deaminase-related metal-dependent hydrolase